MSALSECLGASQEFVARNGKKYKVSLITQNIKVAFERQMFSRAKEVARGMKDLMDKTEYADHLHALGADFTAGEFGLESKRGVEFLKTPGGMTLLTGLLFGVDEHEALKLVKEEQVEVVALIRLIIRESYSLTEEEMQTAEQAAEGTEAPEKKTSHTVPALRHE